MQDFVFRWSLGHTVHIEGVWVFYFCFRAEEIIWAFEASKFVNQISVKHGGRFPFFPCSWNGVGEKGRNLTPMTNAPKPTEKSEKSNQKLRLHNDCLSPLRRFKQGPLYGPNHLISQSAMLKEWSVQGCKRAKFWYKSRVWSEKNAKIVFETCYI